MRKFRVWAEVKDSEVIVEMPDESTDEECEEACRDACDSLISNGDTGWLEVD